LQSVSFVYEGASTGGVDGFRLHVLDPDCKPLATTSVLSAPSGTGPMSAEVDLESLGVCVQSGFAVTIEPLSCPMPEDCFPAVLVDATSDADAEAHCGVVAVLAGGAPECLAPRSSDGRYFDFRLRAVVDCTHPGCVTAIRPQTWSHVKRLYGDPAGTP
jgi:hypothetical protein